MTDSRRVRGSGQPRVITFYSYKGGVGRSMALASVAALLSAEGLRVLAVDWDLEAPGIERFFLHASPDLAAAVAERGGVVDLAHARWTGADLDWRACLVEVPAHGPPIGLITAGRRDAAYTSRMQDLDWPALFQERDFGTYLEAMRAQWLDEFDFVLIDSRTGISDIGGICTINLPDALVALLTANHQSLEGIADVARRARQARSRLPFDRGQLIVVPVLGRDESRVEYAQGREWRERIAARLRDLYADFLPRELTAQDALDLLRIPSVPHWSFGERIPALEESGRDPDSITYAYATLARLLSSGLDGDVLARPAGPTVWADVSRRSGGPWPLRVHLGHTTELREFPKDRSFVAAAVDAVARAGSAVTDMSYFAARDSHPASSVAEQVANADVYVGIVGFRYGSPVRDRPDISYAELEFEVARELRLPRLVFLLDEGAEIPLPVAQIVDRQYGDRQEAFRRRIEESALTVARVASPAELEVALYQALVEVARDVTSGPPDRVAEVSGASVAVPLGRLPMQVRGREELLRSLQDQRGVAILAGMGGVGKSTVAAELTQRLAADRQVWWLSAADLSSLTAGMVTVARRLGASEADVRAVGTQSADAPDRVWALLERAPEGWLLVLDNADRPEVLAGQDASVADGTGWVRAGGRGLVLVTSRRADPATWGLRARVHRLDPLPDADAARVLHDLAPAAGDQAEAELLSRRLGGLPLALHLAGSYLSSGTARWSSFASYREALDQEPAGVSQLLSPDPDTPFADDPRSTVLRTWELSLDDLDARGVPQARTVLRLLSCFAAAVPIPMELLAPASIEELLGTDLGDRSGPPQLRLDQALRGLARLGLIETVAGPTGVVVHPIIADASRARLIASGPEGAVHRTAADLIAAAIRATRPEQPADWPRFRALTPHVRVLLTMSAPHLDDAGLAALVEAANRTATAHRAAGATVVALELARLALDAGARLGSDHPAVMAALQERAYETAQLGRLTEAESMYRELLETRLRVLGPDDPATLLTRYGLARSHAYQGRLAEAEAELRDILTVQGDVVGADHSDTLRTRQQLARVIGKQGRWDEAEAAYGEILETHRRLHGDDHPDTLTTAQHVARAIAGQARWSEAEAAYRALVDARTRVLGDDHPSTLAARGKLAEVVAAQARWKEAEAGYRDVLDVQRRVLGDEHPQTLDSRFGLALLAGRQGRRAEAAAALRELVDARRRLFGDEHPDTVAARGALEELEG